MGFLDRLLTKNRPVRDARDWVGATVTTQDVTSSARRHSAVNAEATALLNRLRGEIMTCLRVNAKTCAGVPVRLYRRSNTGGSKRGTKAVPASVNRYLASGRAGLKAAQWAEQDGGVVEVTDHPVVQILTRPNPWDVGTEFWQLQYLYKFVAGHSIEWYDMDRDGPHSAWCLMPQHTHVVRDDTEGVVGYSYGRESADVVDFPAESTFMFKYELHPWDPFRGYSLVEGILAELDLEQAGVHFDLEFVKEGQVPPFVVKLGENATTDQIKDAQRQLRDQLGGLRGKLRGLVLAQADVQALTITPRELQSREKAGDIRQRIRKACGWTESMNDSNASTYAAAELGEYQFRKNFVLPTVALDCEQRTERVLSLFGLEPGEWFLAPDDPVPQDLKAEEDASRQDVAYGVMTINEARQLRGLPKVPDGDALRFNGVPLDKVGQQAPGLGGIPVSFTGGGVPVVDRRTLDCGHGEHRDRPGAAVAQLPEGEVHVGGDAKASALAGNRPRGGSGEDLGEVPERPADACGKRGAARPDSALVRSIRQLGCGDGCEPACCGHDTKDLDCGHGDEADWAVDGRDDYGRARQLHRVPVSRSLEAHGGDGDPAGRPALLLQGRIAALRNAGTEHGCAKCCDGSVSSKDLPAPAWVDEATERDLRSILEGYLRDVADEVVTANGRPSDAALAQLRAQLDGEIRPILSAALSRSAMAAMDDLGMASELDDFVPQYAIDFLDTHVPRLSGQITTTLAEEVGGIVQDGLREGLTNRDIAKEIEDSGFAAPRAERIARTEAQIALQEGKLAGWREVGVEKKEWQLAPGNCPLCQGIKDRGVVPIGEPFARAGEVINGVTVQWDVQMPPAHQNCRCNGLAVFAEDA